LTGADVSAKLTRIKLKMIAGNARSIQVDTLPGEFTEIRVILPRAAVFA
jgi:hypothetical protein